MAIWVSNKPIWSDKIDIWTLNKKFENTMNVIFPMYFGEKRGCSSAGSYSLPRKLKICILALHMHWNGGSNSAHANSNFWYFWTPLVCSPACAHIVCIVNSISLPVPSLIRIWNFLCYISLIIKHKFMHIFLFLLTLEFFGHFFVIYIIPFFPDIENLLWRM